MITKSQFATDVLPFTLSWEKGYANDVRDNGGETYRGISRKNNPAWSGWPYIDSQKPIAYNKVFPLLESSVVSFYWDKYFNNKNFSLLDSAKLATALFDYAVHGGYSPGRLTVVVNEVSGSKLDYSKGLDKTAANIINKLSPPTLNKLIVAMLLERKAYLDKLMANPANSWAANGWKNRLNDLAKYIGGNIKKPLPVALVLVALAVVGILLYRKYAGLH